MKESVTRKVLRVWFRVQIVLLCVMLLAAGVHIVEMRTDRTANGVPASVQTDASVPTLPSVPEKLLHSDLWEFAGLLPAPVGNMVSLYLSIQNIDKEDVKVLLGKLHNSFL